MEIKPPSHPGKKNSSRRLALQNFDSLVLSPVCFQKIREENMPRLQIKMNQSLSSWKNHYGNRLRYWGKKTCISAHQHCVYSSNQVHHPPPVDINNDI
jgi:hypothetical protein